MQRPHFPIALTALVAALLTSGCTARIGGDESDSKQSVTVVIGDSTAAQGPALGAGDVRIVSTDNVLVLSLIGDTVRMQLSDSLRNSVGAEIAKDADTSGLAGMITKSVSPGPWASWCAYLQVKWRTSGTRTGTSASRSATATRK
jgi:hypothetical protein